METGRKIWDAKLKLTIYASRLELRQFVVVTARDDGNSDRNYQLSSSPIALEDSNVDSTHLMNQKSLIS